MSTSVWAKRYKSGAVKRSAPVQATASHARPVPPPPDGPPEFEHEYGRDTEQSEPLVGELLPREGSKADVRRRITTALNITNPNGVKFKQQPLIGVHKGPPSLDEKTGQMDSGEARALHQNKIITAFAVTHMGFLRYDMNRKEWLVFTGTKWTPTQIAAHVRSFLDRMKHGFSSAQQKEMSKLNFAEGIERGASTEPGIATRPDQWDQGLHLIATPHGVVDLRTGEMREADRKDLIRKSTAVSPMVENRTTGELDPGQCPTWLRCLGEWFGDDDTIAFVQRYIGYCLTGDVEAQKFLYLWGDGGNGKSLITSTLRHVMGDYGQGMSIETVTEHKNARHLSELAVLQGARLVVASEPPKGFRFNDARIKNLTGEASIKADLKFRDPIDFDVTFKLIITANPAPTFSDCSEAMKRRLIAVELPSIAPALRDYTLAGKLKAEAPGILRWAIQGAADALRGGLRVPARIEAESRAHVESGDTIEQWMAERCIRNASAMGRGGELWRDYDGWSKFNGHLAMSNTMLGRSLTERGFRKHRNNGAV